MKKNWLLSIGLLLVLSLFLAACGGGSDDGADEGTDDKEEAGSEDPEYISFLTGGTSGTYYPLGGAIAKIIADETGIQADAVSSNASADNMIALKDGEAEMAFTQTDVAAYAAEGINAFDEPIDTVLGVGSLYPETIQIVTTQDSGIKTVEDLEGEKVSVGAPGSGTYINAEQILEAYDMTMDDIDAQNLDFGESVGGIKDGNIGAAFITAGTPTGAVEELKASAEVHIIPVEADKAEALIEKYPYYALDEVPEGTYGVEEDVETVAVLAMIVVTEDLSEDAVYDMTKALYEKSDDIAHAKSEEISIDRALDGIGIEMHPGAQKYFDEEGIEAE